MKIILYENNQVNQLHPITLTRASFDIFCGGVTLYDLLKIVFPGAEIDFIVRDYLAAITDQRHQAIKSDEQPVLFLDGSLVPSFVLSEKLRVIVKEGEDAILKSGERVAGAFILREQESKRTKEQNNVDDYLAGLDLPIKEIKWPNFNYPWEVITFNQEILKANLEVLKKGYEEIKPGVFAGQDVEIAKETVFDPAEGLILIGEGTKILPFVYLKGPLYLGKNCLIKEFTFLKDSSCVGEVCKIGGEVEASIFQGYANKQHYGFLGHSYLGEWVNLGAGTTNSDLKNNYGPVKMAGVDTGRQFLGCVIGDYSKTAINTSIFTGKVIGVSSFLYGTIYSDVASFINCASQLGCVVEFNLAEARKVQKAVFSRRGKEPSEAEVKLLADVFELTKRERLNNGIKAGKLEFKV